MREPDPVALLKDLISVRSPTGEEDEVRAMIEEFLRDHGVPYEVDDFGNVLAGTWGGLLLNAHMDTVPGGEGWRITEPYDPRIVSGRVYGRGAADCKGGLAAALVAVVRAHEEGIPLSLLATVGEESPREEDNGTLHACREGLDAAAAVVCEPTDGHVNVGDRGRVTLEVRITGESAHASKPQEGRNPIEAAADAVEAISSMDTERLEVPGVGEVRSDVTVTGIEAGGPSNVIPHECTLTVDYRTVPGETPEDVRKAVEKEVVRSVDGKYDVEVRVKSASRATVVDTDSFIVKAARRAARAAGLPGGLRFKMGHCDIDYLVHEAGLDAVILGPKGGNIHGPDEWVSVESVRRCAEAYLKCAKIMFPTPVSTGR